MNKGLSKENHHEHTLIHCDSKCKNGGYCRVHLVRLSLNNYSNDKYLRIVLF